LKKQIKHISAKLSQENVAKTLEFTNDNDLEEEDQEELS